MSARSIKLIFIIASGFGLLSFIRRWFDELANAGNALWQAILLDEISATWSAAVLLIPVISSIQHKPPWRWPKWLIYIPVAVLFAIAHTGSIYLIRAFLYPIFGFGTYVYGDLGYRFIMEAPIQMMVFSSIMLIMYVIHQGQIARQAERLRTRLAQNQLQALQLQLAPHFLFNTLNTISNTVYESPQRADQLIGRLANMLRKILSNGDANTITLAEEMELVSEYIEVQRYRFEDRVFFTSNVQESHLQLQLPALILQPLIENIFKHGHSDNGDIHVSLTSQSQHNKLIITIEDQGAGLSQSPPFEKGIGLNNVSKRLQLMYGDEAHVQLSPGTQKGTRATLEIPQCV